MGIAEDITKLRDAGRSDDEILSGLEKFAPQYSEDIGKLRADKRPSADILSGIQKFEGAHGVQAQKSLLEKITDPFKYGASQAAQGHAETLNQTVGPGAISDVAQTVLKNGGAAIGPSNYEPANVTWNPKTWGDIPKALGESAAGMGEDIVAGGAGAAAGGALGAAAGSIVPGPGTAIGGVLGGVLGGVGGAVASYGARNYGNDVRRAAAVRTGDDNSVPESVDKQRALAATLLGGAASRIGLKGSMGSPVTAAGGSLATQLAPQIAKAAAVNATASTAGEAAHQALIERQIDPSKLGGAAVTGAATGGAIRGVTALRDVNAASKFKDLTPAEARPVAEALRAVHGDEYKGTGKQDFEAVTKVGDDLGIRAKTLASDPNVTGHIKALKEANQSDNTREVLSRVQKDIAEQRLPAKDDMADLTKTIGQFPHGADLIDALGQQVTLNKIKGLGNFDEGNKTFSGGMSGSPFAQKFLNPVSKAGLYGDAGAAVYAMAGHTLPGLSAMHAFVSPGTALSLPLAQAGTYGTLRAIDAATGARSPTSLFMNRFGGDAPVAPPSAPSGPAFLDTLKAAKAAAKVQKAPASAPAPTVPSAPAPTVPSAPAPTVPSAPLAGISQLPPIIRPPPQATPPAAPQAPAQALPPILRMPPPPAAPNGPATVALTHRDGTRQQVVDDISVGRQALHGGMDKRATARRDILESASSLPLSEAGHKLLSEHLDKVLGQVFHASKPAHARGLVENALDGLSPADAHMVRQHLKSHTDPSTGFDFYGTWQ